MDARASRYHDVYARWQRDPRASGARRRRRSTGTKSRKRSSTRSQGLYGRWFTGGVVNTCYNALDRHIATRNDQVALIYDSPVTNTVKTFTYGRLLSEVQLLGAMLRDFGVKKGDRVILYMPMVPEAVFGMLACARIGAIHSVVFGGFAAKELATRIDDAKPKVDPLGVAAASRSPAWCPTSRCSTRRSALAKHKPRACLILQRPQCEAELTPGRDHDWRKTWEHAVEYAKTSDCVPVAATDPLYILYTSGTTGIPKGVVRDNGGHLVALKWSMQNLYGVKPGEIWWCASDIGWVVGHSYIVYAPLIHGATSIMYEGKPVGTPDAGAFWRVIAAAQGGVAVHRADRLPRHQEGRPRRQADDAIRPVEIPRAVSRRRARRSADGRLGGDRC